MTVFVFSFSNVKDLFYVNHRAFNCLAQHVKKSSKDNRTKKAYSFGVCTREPKVIEVVV